MSKLLRFLRTTGHLRYCLIPHTAFDPEPLARPRLFDGRDPASGGGASWARSSAVDTTMAHSISVPAGVADFLGYVFDESGRLIDGATHKHREGRRHWPRKKRARALRSRAGRPRIEHVGRHVAVLTSSVQSVYFHWLLEILPRLARVPDLAKDVDRFYIEKKHPFQQETLEILGVPGDRIVDAARVPLVTADRLLVPCHQIMRGREFPAWAIQVVRDRFLPAAPGEEGPAPARRIYVSRAGSQHRRVQNEGDLLGKLHGFGFVKVSLETMPFLAQVRCFREAEVVIAAHGSGLANLAFCSPGTRVIELFPAASIDLYYRLSTALRLSYAYVKAREGDPDRLTSRDYEIAWEDLEAVLHALAVSPPLGPEPS